MPIENHTYSIKNHLKTTISTNSPRSMVEDQHIGLGHLFGECGTSQRPAEGVQRVRVTARFGRGQAHTGDQRQGEKRQEATHLRIYAEDLQLTKRHGEPIAVLGRQWIQIEWKKCGVENLGLLDEQEE